MKVFVYGTLKPGEVNYQRYCAGKVIEVAKAYTWGQLFALPLLGYPAMTPGKTQVKGYLLTFASQEILQILDDLEDYDPKRSPEENEYYRQQIFVYNPSGKSLGQAWVYLMRIEQLQHLQGVLLPSGWWSGRGLQSF